LKSYIGSCQLTRNPRYKQAALARVALAQLFFLKRVPVL
jgi:hypothetical protein